jgi:hypothetical protein
MGFACLTGEPANLDANANANANATGNLDKQPYRYRLNAR